MRYRIQVLDGAATILREMHSDARSVGGAIELITGIEWPPKATTLRILDLDGREVYSRDRD